MKILHIIRDKGHELALSTALAQATDLTQKVALLLIHDAVLTRAETLKGLEVFALKDDVEARGVGDVVRLRRMPLLDYNGMLELIFESDKVIAW
ncbi:MAG TPA: DsrH/TusB family sulfur metabolism protein [Candidatus Brocadiales bacterium]|nr:DsrH/TusB family sulfur metabolism protein [Candidatus Brocadiales bacterium]